MDKRISEFSNNTEIIALIKVISNVNPNDYIEMNDLLSKVSFILDNIPCNRFKLCMLAFREELLRQVQELKIIHLRQKALIKNYGKH